jgi:hypothetical protein
MPCKFICTTIAKLLAEATALVIMLAGLLVRPRPVSGAGDFNVLRTNPYISTYGSSSEFPPEFMCPRRSGFVIRIDSVVTGDVRDKLRQSLNFSAMQPLFSPSRRTAFLDKRALDKRAPILIIDNEFPTGTSASLVTLSTSISMRTRVLGGLDAVHVSS